MGRREAGKAAGCNRLPRSRRAIDDALEPFGVRVRDLPATPERIVEMLEAGRQAEAR